MNSYQIAVASTDGKVVNQHFGKAERFYIARGDPDEHTYHWVEERKVQRICHAFRTGHRASERQ